MKKTKAQTITAFLTLLLTISTLPILVPAIQAANTDDNQTFSIMQITDFQHLAFRNPTLYDATTSWIVSNAASYNLKMVAYTGDFVDAFVTNPPPPPIVPYNSSQIAQEWTVANAAMNKLLAAGIPYCWDAGNHDQTPFGNPSGTMTGSSYTALNAATMRSKPYWVSDIYDSKNTAVKFTAGSYSFLIINVEFMANSSTIAWMKSLLDKNPSANVIVATHGYLNANADYSSTTPATVTWNNAFKSTLDSYPNVFLAVSGHIHGVNMTRVGSRQEILFDRQEANNGTGAASVRIYTFNTTSKKVSASTYCLDTQSWLTDSYNQFIFDASITEDWTLTTNARPMKAYPDLQESIWQKSARMLPNGQYDKVGLHRLVKVDTKTKGVVFILPGVYGSGESLISNPTTDGFAKTENDANGIYWAKKGFDVYSIDFRNHFIPEDFNTSQLSFTADWGIDQFMSDIKEAVQKTKEVSGAQKVFLAGISWGGIMAQFYAAKNWQQDLQGLVLLDPGPVKSAVAKNQNLTNSYNLTNTVNTMKAARTWAYENPQVSSTPSSLNPGYVFWCRFAAQNPGAPAQYPNGTLVTTINPRTNKTWANITELFEYTGNTGRSFNTYGGMGNITTYMNLATKSERYYPARIFLDFTAMLDWAVCPYLSFDYVARVKDINVPVIAFRSGLNLVAYGDVINRMTTTDFTWSTLPNYGHLDVFSGTYSARDVSEPSYQWMLSHLSTLDVTARSSATVLPSWTWWFFVQNLGGNAPYTYQWYEGQNPIQGQTSMILPISKPTPGSYSFYCRVTDKDGTTTTSNAVTLNVMG